MLRGCDGDDESDNILLPTETMRAVSRVQQTGRVLRRVEERRAMNSIEEMIEITCTARKKISVISLGRISRRCRTC